MKNKVIIVAILFIIDIVIVKFWLLKNNKPIPLDTLYIVFVSFYCFVTNIAISIALYFIKKHFTVTFMINAFLLVFILWVTHLSITKNYKESAFDEWMFNIKKKKYYISYSTFGALDNNDFDSIYTVAVKVENGTNGVHTGTVHIKNDTIYFSSIDNCQYYIYGDTLYNFKGVEKIKVKKLY